MKDVLSDFQICSADDISGFLGYPWAFEFKCNGKHRVSSIAYATIEDAQTGMFAKMTEGAYPIDVEELYE